MILKLFIEDVALDDRNSYKVYYAKLFNNF